MTHMCHDSVSFYRIPSATLMENIDHGGSFASVKVEGICETSVPSSEFCCEPKTSTEKNLSTLKTTTTKNSLCKETVTLPHSCEGNCAALS